MVHIYSLLSSYSNKLGQCFKVRSIIQHNSICLCDKQFRGDYMYIFIYNLITISTQLWLRCLRLITLHSSHLIEWCLVWQKNMSNKSENRFTLLPSSVKSMVHEFPFWTPSTSHTNPTICNSFIASYESSPTPSCDTTSSIFCSNLRNGMWQEVNSESEETAICHSLPSRANSMVDNTDEQVTLCQKVLQATSITPEAE